MKKIVKNIALLLALVSMVGCVNNLKKETVMEEGTTNTKQVTAEDILGNPEYLAISYGGYRNIDHDVEPAIDELKEDLKLLSAMGIKIMRTYKVHLPQATNLLKAISELKQEDPEFDMYVMLGAWIDCKNAWTSKASDHDQESETNESQIMVAAHLASKYPDIVKIIAVGNESMVKWAEEYYVQPGVILKWVNHLQDLKKSGKLPKDLWITSSDNFASWGGGGAEYHVEDLNKLINAVDYISMHTYPVLDTHYNADFWIVKDVDSLTDQEKIEASMLRALALAQSQYEHVSDYVKSIGVDKPIHIGETGWTTVSSDHFGPTGSRAADEYKSGRYYELMRDWTNEAGLSCFYFEAFNEPWKDPKSETGSENHFGLFTVEGQAKYALWDMVDRGVFKGLTRGGNVITKTFNGDKQALMKTVLAPPTVD